MSAYSPVITRDTTSFVHSSESSSSLQCEYPTIAIRSRLMPISYCGPHHGMCSLMNLSICILLVRTRGFADDLAGDNCFHDLGGAVADFESDHVAHALLMRQVEAEPEMAVEQNALMQDVGAQLG